MNQDQIRQVWLDNGGSPAAADVAAAVAMAESGGNPSAHNGNSATGDDSWGLWQINYFGALYWPRVAAFGMPDTLTDPNRAAQAAITLSSNGANWRPWTTYTSGAYRQYLNAPLSSGSSSPAGSTAAASSAASQLLPGHSGLTLWGMVTNEQQLAQGLVRLGEVMAGGLVLAFGLVLVGYSIAGRQVQGATRKAVKRVTPAGRATSLLNRTNRNTRQHAADTRAAEVQAREDRLRRRVERDESAHVTRRTTRVHEGKATARSRPRTTPAPTGLF